MLGRPADLLNPQAGEGTSTLIDYKRIPKLIEDHLATVRQQPDAPAHSLTPPLQELFGLVERRLLAIASRQLSKPRNTHLRAGVGNDPGIQTEDVLSRFWWDRVRIAIEKDEIKKGKPFRFKDERDFFSWTGWLMGKVLLEFHKDAERDRKRGDRMDVEAVPGAAAGGADAIARLTEREAIYQAIDETEMSDAQREVLRLCLIHGETQQFAADRVGLSRPHVANLLKEAKKRVAETYERITR